MTALTEAARTREAVFEALLTHLQHQAVTQTEIVAYLTSGMVNNVLLVELITFDATGAATREFGTAIGSVSVANHSDTGSVIVQAGGSAGLPPGGGVAIAKVRKATFAVLNLTGHVVTLYGTAGDTATLQAFTKGQPPATGPA